MKVIDENGNEVPFEEALKRQFGVPYVPGSFADPTRTAEVEAARIAYEAEHGPSEDDDA